MLSSLPPLFPHSPHMLFHPSVSLQPSNPPSSSAQGNNPAHPNPHAAAHANNTINGNNLHPAQPQPARTFLSVLRADEKTILMRKANIRRFGAGWLRPIGVGKTLQGMADERAEREEVAAGSREFTNANPRSVTPTTSPHASPPTRDLDDDVPNADDTETAWVDEDEEDDDDDDDDDPNVGDEDLDLDLDNVMDEDDDLLPRDEDADTEGDGDYAPEAGDIDLDAEIPEGDADGGYEHTDTEIEDESSFDVGYGADGVLGRSVWGQGGEGVGGRIGGGVGSGVAAGGAGAGEGAANLRRGSVGVGGSEGVIRAAIRGEERRHVVAGNAAGGRRSSRGAGGGGGGGGGAGGGRGEASQRSTMDRHLERDRDRERGRGPEN